MSDSSRIRREVLAWAGVHPSDDEMRTHLAVSPCNYWPFGSHPFFRERGEGILADAERWLARLLEQAARAHRIPLPALRAYAGEILDETVRALAEPRGAGDGASSRCPVAAPFPCVNDDRCR